MTHANSLHFQHFTLDFTGIKLPLINKAFLINIFINCVEYFYSAFLASPVVFIYVGKIRQLANDFNFKAA